jgi:putative inorganic carbon (hco3(-)) transporter
MQAELNRPQTPPLSLLLLSAFIAVGLASFIHPAVVIIGLLCIGVGLFFLQKPFAALLLLVTFRSGIDIFARQYRMFDGTALSINLLGILNIALILLAIFYFLVMKRQVPSQPFWLAFSSFLYIASISILISSNRIFSLRGLMQVGSYLAIYLLLADQIRQIQDLRKLRLALIVSTIIPVLLGIYQYLTGTGNTVISPGTNRIMGTFFHPSAFGMYLIILWPIVLVEWQQSRRWLSKISLVILLSALTFCLIMTYTRVVWLALLLNILGAFFIFRRFRLMLGTGIVGIWVAIVSWQPIMARFGEAVQFQNGQIFFSEFGSVAWRFQQWQIAINLFTEHPLLGVGWWTFPDYNIWNSTPHNDYLRLAAETGILGLIFYGFLLLTIISRLTLAYWHMPRRSPLTQQVGIVLLTLLTYILLSITDNPLGQPEVSWYLWAILALGVGSIRLNRQLVTS